VIQVQCTKCDRISEAPHANFTFIMCQVCTTNGDIGFMESYGVDGVKERHKGQAGIRIIVANGEMLIYHDYNKELLFSRPIYEGEWDELLVFLRGVEVKA